MKAVIYRVCRVFKWVLVGFGSVALLMIILAFTSAPFWIRYNLGTAKSGVTGVPEYIVVLGGGGIPSESGLMRTYYGAMAAHRFPDAMVIVALPGDREDSLSSLNQMKNELIVRGVPPERILLEDSGMNTRAEALFVKELIAKDERRGTWDVGRGTRDEGRGTWDEGRGTWDEGRGTWEENSSSTLDPLTSHLLLVTSPEHLYRSVLTFEKAGFRHVDGIPAFERDVESGLLFSAKKLGGRAWIPDVGESLTLRYRFWNYLQFELFILREWTAITYYWLMGWI